MTLLAKGIAHVAEVNQNVSNRMNLLTHVILMSDCVGCFSAQVGDRPYQDAPRPIRAHARLSHNNPLCVPSRMSEIGLLESSAAGLDDPSERSR